MDARIKGKLYLIDDADTCIVDVDCFTLGSAGDNQLTTRADTFTSRHHASIVRQANRYVLKDHSTNGTYVQTEDERIVLVHRAETVLWGHGWISLGEPPSAKTALRFELA